MPVLFWQSPLHTLAPTLSATKQQDTMFDDSQCQFSATTNSVSHISNILGAIAAVNSRVVVNVTEEGLNFITENSHICRVELTLEKGLFSTYSLYKREKQSTEIDGGEDTTDDEDEDDGDPKFTVDIVPIVESLSLVNKTQVTATQCTMIYQGHGFPFVLIYEDTKITERCEFSTYVNLDFEANSRGFDLNQDDIAVEGMIKADVLYDALKDLKDINSDDVYLYASTQNKRNKRLAIISKGEMGNSSLYLPNDRSILEHLHITDPSRVDVSCYKFSLFSMTLRAMKLSNKCKFKRDQNILNINLLCLFGNDLPKNYTGTIFDFKMLQLADRDDQMAYFVRENSDVGHNGTTTYETTQRPLETTQHQEPHRDLQQQTIESEIPNSDPESPGAQIDIPVFL